jgi:hypothetical protein
VLSHRIVCVGTTARRSRRTSATTTATWNHTGDSVRVGRIRQLDKHTQTECSLLSCPRICYRRRALRCGLLVVCVGHIAIAADDVYAACDKFTQVRHTQTSVL